MYYTLHSFRSQFVMRDLIGTNVLYVTKNIWVIRGMKRVSNVFGVERVREQYQVVHKL